MAAAGLLRIGVVTAFPPGRNSLNEFGFHLVRHLSRLDEIGEVLLYADETDAGAPDPMPKVRVEVCWGFNRLSNIVRVVRAVRATRPDAVLLNLQFATFGDRRIPGAIGLLTPAVLRFLRGRLIYTFCGLRG
jgi:hypothetical protein